MPLPLCTGAQLSCSMGLSPSVFVSTSRPGLPMILGAMPAATIDQTTPSNIPPFGMCRSQANPAVAAATAAASGTPTPAPCAPTIVTPWMPPAVTPIATLPTANATSRCTCAYGGSVSVAVPLPGPVQST